METIKLNPLFTEQEVMEYLSVGRDAMQKFRRDQDDPIPYLKAGRRFLYDLGKIRKWLERQARRK